jgi:hypothetical protein
MYLNWLLIHARGALFEKVDVVDFSDHSSCNYAFDLG